MNVRVQLVLALDPPAAQLVVDLPDGRQLLALELSGEELLRLLAGEPCSVPSYVNSSVFEHERPEELGRAGSVEADGTEVEAATPLPGDEQVSAPGVYGSTLTEPPEDTEPVTRAGQLQPPHRVVAYVAGRWRTALVVSRDQRSALVSYVAEGPFGDRLSRIRLDQVRLPASDAYE